MSITLELPSRPLTVDDLDNLPPGRRYELHRGSLLVMSPVTAWHQHVESEIRNVLMGTEEFALTQVTVVNTPNDTRVPDVAAFYAEVEDEEASRFDASVLSLVVEVWSPSSDGKDRDPQWYADRGIPRYWLAERLAGEKWGALITMYELARTSSGVASYVQVGQTTLAELQRHGIPQQRGRTATVD